jgi:hypothetical protein
VNYADYCRQIESYLCQKNGGHLIRIVGPAFERVCGWADRGVPIKIAFGGIDRFCERRESKAGRRRPVRIEFCEADVLALFDDWRRAVGVAHAAGSETAEPATRKASLAAHIERVIARLVARRTPRSASFEERVASSIAALDELASAARQARGAARASIVDRLDTLDRDMVAAAMADVDAQALAGFTTEAEQELAPFQSRMPAEARTKAREAAIQRLVRESFGLPTIRYEG